jgi:WhiB family redox-sensing transcriptional regulator
VLEHRQGRAHRINVGETMQVNARSAVACLASDEAGRAGQEEAINPNDWRLRALCAQTDPEAFFPEKGGSARAALAVCAECPVRGECLNHALENDERFGVWGGTTERERRRLRRQRQEAADEEGHVPGLCARGDGRWAVSVKYRRPGGAWAQLSTTVTGDRAAALRRLEALRERVNTLQAAAPAGEVA